jgi:hypothetical protein
MSKSKIQFTEVQFNKLMDLCDHLTIPRSTQDRLDRYLVKGEDLDDTLRFQDKEHFHSYLDIVRDIYKDALSSNIPEKFSKGSLSEDQFNILSELVVMPNSTNDMLKDYFCKNKSVDIDENFIQWADLLRVANNQILAFKGACMSDPQHKLFMSIKNNNAIENNM